MSSVSRSARVALLATAGLAASVVATTAWTPSAHADHDEWREHGRRGDRDDWRHGGWGDRDHDDWNWRYHRGGGPVYVAPPAFPSPGYYYYGHPYYGRPWVWHAYPPGPHIYIGP